MLDPVNQTVNRLRKGRLRTAQVNLLPKRLTAVLRLHGLIVVLVNQTVNRLRKERLRTVQVNLLLKRLTVVT
jgi:hypothetical protein